MSTTSPPPLAAWLLERLVSGPKRESLIGDLAEQYEHGRSAEWYWRQVLTAILVGTARDIRARKRLAAGAALITWLIVIPWVEFTWTLYLSVSEKEVYAWTDRSVVLFEFWVPFGGGLPLVLVLRLRGNRLAQRATVRRKPGGDRRRQPCSDAVIALVDPGILALWPVPEWGPETMGGA